MSQEWRDHRCDTCGSRVVLAVASESFALNLRCADCGGTTWTVQPASLEARLARYRQDVRGRGGIYSRDDLA